MDKHKRKRPENNKQRKGKRVDSDLDIQDLLDELEESDQKKLETQREAKFSSTKHHQDPRNYFLFQEMKIGTKPLPEG